MNKTLVALCLSGAALLAAPALAAASEAELRARLQGAVWPADIVRLADEYRRQYPDSAWRANADSLAVRAADAARALDRGDVRLFRGAFTADLPAAVQEDVRRAALGERAAAVRLARAHLRGEAGLAPDVDRYVGWLQFASTLGDEGASYELALHYRREAQPQLAARYQERAVEQGFVLPSALDHNRK